MKNILHSSRSLRVCASLMLASFVLVFKLHAQARVLYVYGDVSEAGAIPSGPNAPAFDQMRLGDTTANGTSMFKQLVEDEGHTITERYDRNTTLSATFLANYDVIVFTLHQKVWPQSEKDALRAWIRGGGAIMVYSDSAAGGFFRSPGVGAQNTVGQSAVNSLITEYGMQVAVDQANGIKAYRAGPGATHPIVAGRPILEGEGVSPVAIDRTSGAVALIPYVNNPDFKVSGDPTIPHKQNITIQNPRWAALALREFGSGLVIAMFDRQPVWNNGNGSNIQKRDNREILRRTINFMADNALTAR